MKPIIIAYVVFYLLCVLGAGGYSAFKTKKMPVWRLSLVLLACVVVATCLWLYAQAYNPWQIVGFALSFAAISTLFMANGLKDEQPNFWVFFGMNALRLVIHLQLLFFLYFFR